MERNVGIVMGDKVLAERYQLRDELGRGATGVLWRGWDERDRREVAVRVLPPSYGEPDAHARLSATMRTLEKVQDQRMAQVLDHGQAPDGTVFVVTEMDSSGRTLAQATVDSNFPPARRTSPAPPSPAWLVPSQIRDQEERVRLCLSGSGRRALMLMGGTQTPDRASVLQGGPCRRSRPHPSVQTVSGLDAVGTDTGALTAGGDTAIRTSLEKAYGHLGTGRDTFTAIVLMTDGENTAGAEAEDFDGFFAGFGGIGR